MRSDEVFLRSRHVNAAHSLATGTSHDMDSQQRREGLNVWASL